MQREQEFLELLSQLTDRDTQDQVSIILILYTQDLCLNLTFKKQIQTILELFNKNKLGLPPDFKIIQSECKRQRLTPTLPKHVSEQKQMYVWTTQHWIRSYLAHKFD